jgi:hypothetical protein
MKLLNTLFGIFLASAGSLAAAQWQWIDKDGHQVFSDRAPPPEISDKNILQRPRAYAPPAAAAAEAGVEGDAAQAQAAPLLPESNPKVGGIDKDLEARKKAAAQAEASKRKADEERVAKVKIENCARAKQAKATLDSGVRIGRVNAAGEREIMDDAARTAEARRIAGVLATDCK